MVRAAGVSGNFRIVEDVWLTESYVMVTTNAAVGTDQNGDTFWMKVQENFVRRGGGALRSQTSLKNRFNRVIQLEVNKYIGYLQASLREYHSGWVMTDYVNKAKTDFHCKEGNI